MSNFTRASREIVLVETRIQFPASAFVNIKVTSQKSNLIKTNGGELVQVQKFSNDENCHIIK